MKKIMPILLVVLMLLSTYMLITERIEIEKTYESYLTEARDLGRMGIVSRSASYYDSALAIKGGHEISIEKAEMFLLNGYFSSALTCAEELVNEYPKEVAVYEFLLKLYFEQKEYRDFFSVVGEVSDRGLESEVINEMVSSIRYVYELGSTEYDVVMNCKNGYWPACRNGLWGYRNSSGSSAIGFKYKNVWPFVLDVASVVEPDGSTYYIDTYGEKTSVPTLEGNIYDLGVHTDLISISVNDRFGYYSSNYEYKFGDYDYASTFSGGIAAVKNDEKWSLINTNGEALSTDMYVDIVIDDIGVVFRNDRAFVSQDGINYYLIDSDGNKITDVGFSYAESFYSDAPAAVKIGDKWGFVNVSGEVVIEPQYDAAHSFINGFAAVCKNGKWGYIDSNNNVCIEFEFDDALNFNNQGVSMVKTDDFWVSLTLYNVKY